MRLMSPNDDSLVTKALSPLIKEATEGESPEGEQPPGETPSQPERPQQNSPYSRALKAELYRIRGGHAPELQAAIDEMNPQAQQALLGVIRNLQGDVSNEKKKRQRGQFW